jgi:hypothetical protein
MSIIKNDIVYKPDIIILGVFGNTNKQTEQEIQDDILLKILEEIGQMPNKILLPTEGNSSIYIQDWAESMRIKTQTFQPDWVHNGKIAQILRDERIYKECTHALVFLSQKSTRLEKYANKMAKGGKIVFTSYHNQPLIQLVYEKPLRVSEPSRKSNIEKGQTLLKFQKKE